MAIESPHVTADVVEASEFPDLAQRYRLYAVPKTVVNDKVQVEGGMREPQLLQLVLAAVGGDEQSES